MHILIVTKEDHKHISLYLPNFILTSRLASLIAIKAIRKGIGKARDKDKADDPDEPAGIKKKNMIPEKSDDEKKKIRFNLVSIGRSKQKQNLSIGFAHEDDKDDDPDGMAMFTYGLLRRMIGTLMAYRRRNGKLVLVDVISADGDHVRIVV